MFFPNRIVEVLRDLLIESMKTMNKALEKSSNNFRQVSASMVGLLTEVRAFQRTNPEISQLLRTEAFVEVFRAIELLVKAGSSRLYEGLSKTGNSASNSATQQRTQNPRNLDDFDMIDEISFMDEMDSNRGQGLILVNF